MSTGVIDLGLTVSSIPSGSAGGDLTGSYPNPTVATVGGSTAANINTSQLATAAATDANTVSTIVKRDANGNFQAASLAMIHVSSGVDNIGIGGPASASNQFPLLIQRDLNNVVITQLANPHINAGNGVKNQVSADAGNNNGEMGLYTSATAAPDAYAGGQFTIRSSGLTSGISIIADDVATAKIKLYVAGNASSNKAAAFNADLSMHSYGGVILATTGSKPSAGVNYRGMQWFTQGSAGVPDQIEMCMKKTDDTYAWVVVKVAP